MSRAWAPVAVLCVLAAATAYEALVALGVIGLGSEPGEGPQGEGTILLIAVGAMLVEAGLAVLAAAGLRLPYVGLFAPAAAAVLVARFYTFDPYYLPTLRRMSDGGLLSPVLVYGLVAFALAAGFLAHSRRGWVALSAPVILACAFFALIAAGGH
jgi:hypothetical protein